MNKTIAKTLLRSALTRRHVGSTAQRQGNRATHSQGQEGRLAWFEEGSLIMIQEFELALPNTRETFEFLANETEGTGWYIIDETTEQVVIAFESQHMYTRALQELPQL